MFALRGLIVSFAVFVIVYCSVSLAVCAAWQRIRTCLEHQRMHHIADLLFALRMLPLATAALITAVFTVPSFLLLEPRAISEPLGSVPLVFSIGGLALGLFGAAHAGRAMWRASRTIAAWTEDAKPAGIQASLATWRITRLVPAMSAVGILRPRVLFSEKAESVLSQSEFRTALRHELEHVCRRDNLKKLLLHVVAFPGLRGLEMAWLEATEMAADDAAVSNASEALDLAAALIKLSSLGPIGSPADLTTALVQSPASLMNARIERLIAWRDEPRPATLSPLCALGGVFATVAVSAVMYSPLLVRVHTATEWLVR